MWHELSHVYVLAATNHRVPRWFTEGLAVFEETAASPDWGDRLDHEAIVAIRDKKLLPIAEIDRGFEGAEAAVVRGLLQSLARRERLVILASAATPAAASGFADRLVAIADGLLVFDGPPADFSGERVAWRFGTA